MNPAVNALYAEYLAHIGDKAAAASLTLADVITERSAPPSQPSPALTVADAAAQLRLSPDTVYALVAKGELRHHRIGKGRSIRFTPADLDEYQERMTKVARQPLTGRRPNRL